MNQKAKIELHCHLDGSLRVETVLELSRAIGIPLEAETVAELKTFLTAPVNCPSLAEYLKRFDLPIKLMQSEEVLERVSFELMEDCAKEGIKYIEIRFAPLFHQEKGLSIKAIIESVLRGIRRGEEKYDIRGNIILSFLKFMDVETIYPVLQEAKDFIGNGVVAVDLAGNEEEGFSHQFVEAMAQAKKMGYRITIHAGETGYGINVLEAIKLLGAERIGHGVNIRDHAEAYKMVKEEGIALEMCPTSNIQTKAVDSAEDHPLMAFLEDGLMITLNTDNRTVSDTTMTKEIELCSQVLSLTDALYKRLYQNAIEASFASKETKKWLRDLL